MRAFHPLDWPAERVEELKRLAADTSKGCFMSWGYIASILNVTRSSVIGKVHRMKLKRDPKASVLTQDGIIHDPTRVKKKTISVRTIRPKVVRPPQQAPVRPAAPPPVDPTLADGRSPHACGISELDSHRCHFPFGEPRTPEFHYCGGPSKQDGPYCEYHHMITHTAVKSNGSGWKPVWRSRYG